MTEIHRGQEVIVWEDNGGIDGCYWCDFKDKAEAGCKDIPCTPEERKDNKFVHFQFKETK